jgi:hypothetical protein
MEEKTTITIDVDALREALRSDCMGAAFAGGFGGALMEADDVDRATPEQLVSMARRKRIDLRRFQVWDD